MAFPTKFPYDAGRRQLADSLRARLRRRSTNDHPSLRERIPTTAGRWSKRPVYQWRSIAAAAETLTACVAEYKAGTCRQWELVDAVSSYCEELVDLHTVYKTIHRINDAVDETVVIRASCGHVCAADSVVHAHNGDSYCQDCADEYLREPVDDQDEYYHIDDLYYWESDGEYHTEEEPEPEDEDNYDEDDEEDSDRLYGWGASTTDLDHDRRLKASASPTTGFPIGVELEVESGRGQFRDAIDATRRHFGGSDSSYAMLKKDGSLDCYGFEIVTAARDVQDHVKKFESWVPHRSLTSWQNGNCGMHVHLDSKAFTALTLAKFMQFFNDRANYAFIKSIAGRHPMDGGKAESYCQMSGANGKMTRQVSSPSKVTNGEAVEHYSRYRMVNLTNLSYNEMKRLGVKVARDSKDSKSTVELRIFKGTLKKERLLAQIEFAHASLLFCRAAAWHQLTGGSFMAWLRTGDAAQYRNLRRWFGVTTVNPKPTTTEASTAEV